LGRAGGFFEIFDFGFLGEGEFAGVLGGEGEEADFVAGLELAHFPELGLHDRERTHEAAAARAVGAEYDWHVAGEIDRTDGVGVVVDVGRMQAGFAAVAAGPLGLGAYEAHAGAGGVVVNLVGRREERRDVGLGEKIGRTVRAVEDADLPLASEGRLDRRGGAEERGVGENACGGGGVDAEDVAGAEGAAGVSAEKAEGEGGLAAEVVGDVEAVANGEVGA
jgi:hypothetical protein